MADRVYVSAWWGEPLSTSLPTARVSSGTSEQEAENVPQVHLPRCGPGSVAGHEL